MPSQRGGRPAVRTKTPLAIALVDIDHFKNVNDTDGHLAGDEVLQAVTATFRDHLREYDTAGRFGGDEFAILLPHAARDDAFGIAERLRAHIAGLTDRSAPGQAPAGLRSRSPSASPPSTAGCLAHSPT